MRITPVFVRPYARLAAVRIACSATARLLAAASCVILVACQGLSVASRMPRLAAVSGAAVAPGVAAGSGGAGSSDPLLEVSSATAVRGRVDFPVFHVAAASNYAAAGATLTLIDLSTGYTVATGYSDNAGTFYLPLNGFTPMSGSTFLLESTHGLLADVAGSQVARFRTFLQWTGSTWTSTSGSTIVLDAQTTAMAVISSLDPSHVTASSTLGTVSGSSVVSSPDAADYSLTYINNLAAAITSYLTHDEDPVESSSGLAPSISQIDPASPGTGGAMMILGKGFSPVTAGDTVLFGAATASVFCAAADTLGVFVPANAPSSGNVTVTTSLGTSAAVAYTLAVATGSGSGGSGGGGSLGLSISSVSPTGGAPGDTIMIRGSGFPQSTGSVTVDFNGATASVTYADPETLLAAVPANGSSGPLTVTVSGVTVGYYFAYILPKLSWFTPTVGSQATQVTITGQNFGTQGQYSKIEFDGVPSPNVVTWYNTQAVGYVPAPSLSSRISGPLTLITGLGLVSPAGGNFTASQSIDDNLSTTNFEDPGTTAAWGSGYIQPAAAVTTFSQSGSGFSSNTNSGTQGTSSGLTLTPTTNASLNIGGLVQPYNGTYWAHQLGVSQAVAGPLGTGTAGFFLGNSSSTPDYFYNFSGSLIGQITRIGWAESEIWDPTSGLYWLCTGHTSPLIGYVSWNGAQYSSMGPTYINRAAANGTYVMACEYTSSTCELLGNGVSTTLGTVYGTIYDPSPAGYSIDSAAGLTGSNTFYFTSSSGTNTYLSTLTTGNVGGSVNLPFPVGALTNGAYPQVGSDGSYLYMAGTNANFNGGANTLFRFAVTGGAIYLAEYVAGTPETSVTSAIARPANSLWDTLSFSDTVPSGTTLTVDVLDGSTGNVLMSNVTSGASLNGITASSIKLRATLETTSNALTPTLASWSVTTRGAYALSKAYDSGTNFATWLPAVIASNSSSITLQYSDSADGSTWSSWANSPTALSRRYLRYQATFAASNAYLSNVLLPYDY